MNTLSEPTPPASKDVVIQEAALRKALLTWPSLSDSGQARERSAFTAGARFALAEQGETPAERELFNQVGQLLAGWKQGCAPAEWSDFDEQVLQRWQVWRVSQAPCPPPKTSTDAVLCREGFSSPDKHCTLPAGHRPPCRFT